MRLVIQRVSSAKVTVQINLIGEIGKGLFALFGVGADDDESDAKYLAEKLVKLRVMSDESGKMNLSIADTKSPILVVSQFTLYADTRDGNRPSFIKAKEPVEAERLYEYFIQLLKADGVTVSTGSFGSYMKISTDLDGPVTIIIDSRDKKKLI